MTIRWGVNLDGLAGYPERLYTSPYYRYGSISNDYATPVAAEMDYFSSKGMTKHRLACLWERCQHNLYGALDETYMGYLDALVDAAVARDLQIYLSSYSYGRRTIIAQEGSSATRYLIGSAQVPKEAYADYHKKIAQRYRGYVCAYELGNEPYSMAVGSLTSAQNWYAICQTCINTIRTVDAATPIIVPLSGWQATTMYEAGVGDLHSLTGGNLLFAGHTYFDGDTSGRYVDGDSIPTGSAYYDGVPANRGRLLIQNFVNWLRTWGLKGLISETNVPDTDWWVNEVLAPALDYIASASDVLESIQIHTAGTHWPSSYTMALDSIKDSSGRKPYESGYAGIDRRQMALLAGYIEPPPPLRQMAVTVNVTRI